MSSPINRVVAGAVVLGVAARHGIYRLREKYFIYGNAGKGF
jgi:hypothetical protein